MSRKALPDGITSYDLLKTFAVLTMVIDHLGIYFFPEEDWFRTFGRLSFPVWLFLIGYARSRDLPLKLWVGGGALVAASVVAGQVVFPVNILFTIAIVRLSIDPIMRFLNKNYLMLWPLSVLFVLFAIPTSLFTEFGTMAFVMGVFGALVRRQQEEGRPKDKIAWEYSLFVLIAYSAIETLSFGFIGPKGVVLFLGMSGVVYTLYHFRSSVPENVQGAAGPVKTLIQLCGRRTLEFYVIHLLLFKALAVFFGTEGFEFMNWGWAYL